MLKYIYLINFFKIYHDITIYHATLPIGYLMHYTTTKGLQIKNKSKSFKNNVFRCLLIFLLTMTLSCVVSSAENNLFLLRDSTSGQIGHVRNYAPPANDMNVLFGWNNENDNGINWSGWLWQQNVAYGNEGWVLGSKNLLGGPINTYFGQSPRSFDKSDYGDDNLVEITRNERSPSTSRGGALRIFDNPDNFTSPNQASWWMYYGARPLVEKGITSESTDRMSFYIKLKGLKPQGEKGSPDSLSTNFHIGTYLCWDKEQPAKNTGEGCPREGPGNQHYYHYFGFNPGAWIHTQVDDHPNHHRGKPGNRYHDNNPVKAGGMSYFAQLMRFYFEIRIPQTEDTEFIVDELLFYSTREAIEPNQNDESITSLWVGYWPDNDYWEIGFKDGGKFGVGENKFSTFEIRWSTLPITNENYEQSNIVEPLFYSGTEYVGAENPHYVRRANDYKRDVWTRFTLPAQVVNDYQTIYFAVKDVSTKQKNKGTRWPWNRDDHGEAPSSYIRTIDYSLRPVN